MKHILLLAFAFCLCGCKHYRVTDKDPRPKVDTVHHGHYLTYAGRAYSVEHADIMCKYIHDEQMCENVPGTSCYKRKYHGKSESNR